MDKKLVILYIASSAAFYGVGMMFAEPWPWPAGDWRWVSLPIGWVLLGIFLYRKEIAGWFRSPITITFAGATEAKDSKVSKFFDGIKPPLAFLAILIGLMVLQSRLEQSICKEKNWSMTHPSLSLEEQKKADAQCSLKAMEIVGTSEMKFVERLDYRNTCLASKGFVRDIKK